MHEKFSFFCNIIFSLFHEILGDYFVTSIFFNDCLKTSRNFLIVTEQNDTTQN